MSTSAVYGSVVDDVVRKLREQFRSEGVDDNVLTELQELWELKMMQTGAVLERSANPPPRGTNVNTPVHDLNVPYEATEEYETPTAEILFPPTPMETPMQTPLPGITEPVMYQYIPQGPSDFTSMPDSGMGGDVKLGRPAPYMQQPSAWMNQRPLGVDVNIAYEEGRDEDDVGITQPPMKQLDWDTYPSIPLFGTLGIVYQPKLIAGIGNGFDGELTTETSCFRQYIGCCLSY